MKQIRRQEGGTENLMFKPNFTESYLIQSTYQIDIKINARQNK